MSLEPLTVWPQRYVLRCAKRTDLDETLGTLPDHSIYVGSSANLTARLCFHFARESGTQFTKYHAPQEVLLVDARRPRSARECLAWEDELVVDRMFDYMNTYTHPQAWRAVAGGSWSKPDNVRMPELLRVRLAARTPGAPLRPRADDDGRPLLRQQSSQTSRPHQNDACGKPPP